MQLNDDQSSYLQAILRVTQVISAAMISGVLVFAGVAIALSAGKAPVEQPLHSLVAAGAGLIALVAATLVPPFVGGSIKQALVAGKRVELPRQFQAGPAAGIAANLLGLFQTRHILGFAILDGAAFYAIVAYLLERQQGTLLVVGLLLGAMIIRIPTRTRLENWLAAELKSIAELRSLQQ